MRRFLLGLSTDELQFIAGFLGSCILERSIAQCYAQAGCYRALSLLGCQDLDHKMILVREYFGLRCVNASAPLTAGTGG
jgi:hypothetical protein